MTDRILVVGGAGYVGSHVAKAVSQAGFLPVCYDNLSTGHTWAVKWGPLERGDILDREHLDSVVATHRPVAAVLLAGLSVAGDSVSDPGSYYWNNVAGMLCALRVLAGRGVRRVVFSSSAAVYGDAMHMPIREDAPCRPINPYGSSKLMGERLLADFAAAHGLDSIALRYFNACGADPDREIGEAHAPETHLVPLVLEAAAGLRPAIDIFGTAHQTRDGTCVRDFVHVADLADAHLLALRALAGLTGHHVFNLGNGNGSTVREVIAAASEVTGRRIAVNTRPPRAGDPPALVADSALARQVLGWTPRFPGIKRQIFDAWTWHLHHWAEIGRNSHATRPDHDLVA